MKIHVGQIYIEDDADYEFNHVFQNKIAEELTSLVKPSAFFVAEYGEDFKIMFNMSAKRRFKRRPLHEQHYEQTEIWGPTVFRKDKDVEYTIFLPYYDKENDNPERLRLALTRLLDAIIHVLAEILQMDTADLRANKERIISDILANPDMVYGPDSEWMRSRVTDKHRSQIMKEVERNGWVAANKMIDELVEEAKRSGKH